MLLERETVMSTLKAFGISCGVVLGFAIVVILLTFLAEWSSWAFGAVFCSLIVALGTIMLRGK